MIHSSPEAEKLLMRLYDHHRLYQMGDNPHESDVTAMAKTVTDLVSYDLSSRDQDLIIHVVMDLIKQAESDLRRAVAERLSTKEDIPLRLALSLANDDIEVADPILRRSKVLMDMDLIYIVAAKGAEHWQTIATRPEMSDKLIESLARTKDLETGICLVENNNITLTQSAISALGEMAQTSDRLAKPLIMRDEVDNKLAILLYKFVGEELQQYITQNFDTSQVEVVKQEIKKVVADISGNYKSKFEPTSDMVDDAETMLKENRLSIEVLVEHLRRGQINSFIAMFSTYCALPVATVTEILKQDNGQGMAITCKAMAISKQDFINIYLLTGRIRGGQIITQSFLRKALSYYDRVRTADARAILSKSKH